MPTLRRDALKIWSAAVEAVLPSRTIPQWFRVENGVIVFGLESQPTQKIPLQKIRRIAVVGAGKAGAGMVLAVENVLGDRLMDEKNVIGWVNVPTDCVCPTRRIHLHPARPAGVNEPRPEGVAGSLEILKIVESLGPDDLCVCLISGGGSALMPAPVEGVSLADKLAVTRFLSAAGANIEQLNAVRKPLSRIKGGGLRRACRAGRMASLIISDVLGNPLDVIASGPTVEDFSTPEAALEILKQFGADAAGIAPTVFEYLKKQCENAAEFGSDGNRTAAFPGEDAGAKQLPSPLASRPSPHPLPTVHCPLSTSFLIADNATAVAAAAAEARRLGYAVETETAACSEGLAEDVGRRLAEKALTMQSQTGEQPRCFVSGGEPVVRLVESSRRGLGGRNQQLTLAALEQFKNADPSGIVLLSGGTDGEDGPTDAAGAFFDAAVMDDARQRHLDVADFLARNDAYHFFAPLDALVKTGPTQTNVCDVRVVLAGKK